MKYLYFTHTYSFVEIYTKGNINALEINFQIIKSNYLYKVNSKQLLYCYWGPWITRSKAL